MLIKVREKCPCTTGMVQHPAWSHFYEAFPNWPRPGPVYEQIDQWFAEQGYGAVPPEEIPCVECEGSAWIETWIELESLKALLLNLR